MRERLLTVVFVLGFVPLITHGQPLSEKGWKLVWEDNFSGKRLNPDKWNILTRETSKHNELQYYIPEEVSVSDGLLRLTSSKRIYGSKGYTSGRIDTKGKFSPV
jgi:beta-glucanase (GH16 family)